MPLLETATSLTGIVYGSNLMDPSLLNSVNTGTVLGGGVTQNNIGRLLAAVRAKGGRIVLRLYRGRDEYVQECATAPSVSPSGKRWWRDSETRISDRTSATGRSSGIT